MKSANNQATDVVDKRAAQSLDLEPKASAPAPTVVEPRPVSTANPATILDLAVSRGADIAQLTQLLDLKMKWEADEARKAFAVAMAEFKKNPPDIIKDKKVGYEDNKGNWVGYTHATLGAVCDAVIAGLAAVGISHDWKPRQSDGMVGVTCYLTHSLGFKDEGTYLEAGADTSGKKNAIQAISSTVTFMERYTLLAAVGLATKDMDNDGVDHKDPIANWVAEYIEAINACQDLVELIATWKVVSAACRRKQAKAENDELKAVLADRCAVLGITKEQWAAKTKEKVA